MAWLAKSLNSSLGKKLLMAITGLFLISFLVIHCGLNATIFLNDGGVTFNEGAEFMGTNPLIRTMEIVLFVGLIYHIFDGLSLWLENKKKRPVAYAVIDGKANSTWYSRSMGLLGTLLLLFLIIHLKHFWYFSRLTDGLESAFQTLGWNHPTYTPAIKTFGAAYAIIVSIVFAAMPIALHFHLIK